MSDKIAKKAVFTATFPGTQSAISMHGNGGMRIQLEIPDSELGQAALLLMWRNKNLKVTVEPVEEKVYGNSGSKKSWTE